MSSELAAVDDLHSSGPLPSTGRRTQGNAEADVDEKRALRFRWPQQAPKSEAHSTQLHTCLDRATGHTCIDFLREPLEFAKCCRLPSLSDFRYIPRQWYAKARRHHENRGPKGFFSIGGST